MLTKLKKKVQSWLTGVARWAHKLGLTPNQVSAIGVIFAILSGLAYWHWQLHSLLLVAAPILLLLSGFCDALDGVLARVYNKTSIFGGFLDSLLDRYADAIIYFGIILGGLCNILWGLVTLTSSLLVSYTRARAEALGVEMEAVGIAERADRLVIVAIASFISITWVEALHWGIIILAILTTITVLQRTIHFLRQSEKKGIN